MDTLSKAKSTGELLIDHSKRVAEVATLLFENQDWNENDLNEKERIKEFIRQSSLLHDIGKDVKSFQDALKSNRSKKGIHFHHEIGWAFLSLHTYLDEVVLDAVYWHHGINNKMGSYSNLDVLSNKKNKITEEDIVSMRDFVIEVGLGDFLKTEDEVLCSSSKKAPCYWEEDDNLNKRVGSKKGFIRAYVVSADRFVSTGFENPLELSNDIITRSECYVSKDHKYKGERFSTQLSIAQKGSEGTVIFNAPAGFGKTVIGLLWWLNGNRKRKLIWVAPRNAVAESLYRNSIKKDLSSLGIDCSMELYLGGKVIESTHNSIGFDSDIIITNIDNFSQPTINNTSMERLYMIYQCDVVFDEYHEFSQGGNALYGCFTSLMRVRHSKAKSRTALLSATPMDVYMDWVSGSPNEIKPYHLPSLNNHYSASHNKKFKLRVIDGDIPNIKENSSTIVYFNAVSNCQRYKLQNPKIKLVHAQFEKKDREDIVDSLYAMYGKDSELSFNKQSIVSTNLTQASFDVSFYKVYESVISPQDTMQRMGRLNRWGDYSGVPEFHCYLHQSGMQHSAEDTLRSNFYDVELTQEWFNHLNHYDGKEITLNEMYSIYNEFKKKFTKKERKISLSFLGKSTEYLSKIYPNRIHSQQVGGESEIFHADGNKIRKNGMGIFFFCRHVNGGYSDAFSTSIYENNFADFFEEDSSSFKKMKKVIGEIVNRDDRFDFSETYNLLGRSNSTESSRGKKLVDKPFLQRIAKMSNTPYYADNYIYDPEMGYIKKKILNQ